jgi:hypothetical protein
VASANAGAVACARCGLAYSALAACRSASRVGRHPDEQDSYRVEAAAALATLGGQCLRAIRETMSDGHGEEDHPTPLRRWLALRARRRLVRALACGRWKAGQASRRPDARCGIA